MMLTRNKLFFSLIQCFRYIFETLSILPFLYIYFDIWTVKLNIDKISEALSKDLYVLGLFANHWFFFVYIDTDFCNSCCCSFKWSCAWSNASWLCVGISSFQSAFLCRYTSSVFIAIQRCYTRSPWILLHSVVNVRGWDGILLLFSDMLMVSALLYDSAWLLLSSCSTSFFPSSIEIFCLISWIAFSLSSRFFQSADL